MHTTPAAAALLSILSRVGARPYRVLSGLPATSKVSRLSLSNGRPLVVQTNTKTPIVWMLPEHENEMLVAIGSRKAYPIGKSRHHHLRSVREFAGRALVHVTVSSPDWAAIESAFAKVSAPCGPSP